MNALAPNIGRSEDQMRMDNVPLEDIYCMREQEQQKRLLIR